MNEQIILTNLTLNHLESTRKWTLFMSIIGFIVIGLIIIFAFTFGSIMDDIPQMGGAFSSAFVIILYLVMAAIYVPPILHLYRFSTRIKTAVRTKDDELVESAFNALRAHYTYIGILIVIVLGFYVIMAGVMGAIGISG